VAVAGPVGGLQRRAPLHAAASGGRASLGMENAFGRSRPFSLGVEEEFQLVSAESYELVSRFDELLDAAGEEHGLQAELLQSTVEVATGVTASVPEALEQVRANRRRLRDAAAASGTLIASGGTHPVSRYEHHDVTEQERYTST